MTQIKISSEEGTIYSIDLDVSIQSETIKSLINYPEDLELLSNWEPTKSVIPLPNVNNITLIKIIKYMKYHTNSTDTIEEQNKWDDNFMKLDDDILFNIILGSNYLEIKNLLDLSCKTVANYIKSCKTPQEIRKRLKIINDFTPEEEENITKENNWCEDK